METVTTDDSRRLRDALHHRLRTLLGTPRGDEVAYHLADLHDGLFHAARLIERLAGLNDSSHESELRTVLAELNGELFEHTSPHLEKVRPAMEELVSRLFEAADRRGEL